MMKTSTTSVNSALSRARRLVAQRVQPPNRQWTPQELRRFAVSFADAIERGDADALVALLTKDVTWSMPPLAQWHQGIDAVMGLRGQGAAHPVPELLVHDHQRQWRARRRLLRRAARETTHEAWSITVLTMRGDRIAEIVSFLDPGLFPRFGLPAASPDRKAGCLVKRREALQRRGGHGAGAGGGDDD